MIVSAIAVLDIAQSYAEANGVGAEFVAIYQKYRETLDISTSTEYTMRDLNFSKDWFNAVSTQR